MPPEERKRCWGCTSLRSAAIIVGAFDILVSSIAIIVSVAAIVHTQVFSLFSNYAENISKEKSGLDTKGGETWSAASQCKRTSCETVSIF